MLKHDTYIMSTESLDGVNIFFYHPIKNFNHMVHPSKRCRSAKETVSGEYSGAMGF